MEESDISLQMAFESFRQRKSQELRLQKVLSEKISGSIKSRTAEEKFALRTKFVETAFKYIGVPYHEKYKAPDTLPSPLYLDWFVRMET